MSVETLELRNGNNYAKKGLDLTEGRGGQITWAGVVSRVKKAAEKGQLGMVLDAMDAIWDTEGPVPVLAEWLMSVWSEHARQEEAELVDMETGDDVGKREEAKKARESTTCKFGEAREALCWDGMGVRLAEWPRAIGMALARIMAVWGELGAAATWDNGLLAEIIAMGMELQGIAWGADKMDTDEALGQMRAVASRGEQYRRADEAHGELLSKLRSRMESGELEREAAEEMGMRAGKAVYARRLGMAMVTMCASQHQTVESNEALEKIGWDIEREMESMGAALLSVGQQTTEGLKEQWKTMLERHVGGELNAYEEWYMGGVKVAEARRKEAEYRQQEAEENARREVERVAAEREARDKLLQKEKEERERENRRPSLNVTLHIEGDKGHTAVGDLEVLCGRDATVEEEECVSEIGEMVTEAMMTVARRWRLDTVVLTVAEGGWRRFASKYGRQESGLKVYVTSTDPMHMLEYMRRVNDVKMNAGTIEVDRDGEDSEGEDNGMRWTQRAQLRTDWGSAELRNEVAPVTHDKWQIEVDLGQLKVMEGIGHVKALVGTLRDEGIVREMAGRLFERVTAVFWSGESFKAKQTGEKYAKYRAEGTGLALEVEQDGHLPECGKVVSGRGGEMETVIAMSYAVMRAHETQKTMCVNCHVTQRTKDGNDHECGNFRECSSRVWEAMQRTKRAPEAARPPQQLQRFRDGRSANRRDKARVQGGRNATHGW